MGCGLLGLADGRGQASSAGEEDSGVTSLGLSAGRSGKCWLGSFTKPSTPGGKALLAPRGVRSID